MSNVQIHRKHLTLLPSEPQFRPADGKRRSIERAMHHLTLIAAQSVQTDVEEQHREWWYDLRRSHQSVCAAAFRFVDYLFRLGFPIETALLVSDWMRAYTLERYGRTPSAPAGKVVELDRAA
jgi:hypothetical protein